MTGLKWEKFKLNKTSNTKVNDTKYFYVIRSTSNPQGHAQRMKILVTSQKESNKRTIDLNNKTPSFDYYNFFVLWLSIFFSEIPLSCVDCQLLSSLQSFQLILQKMLILPQEEFKWSFSRRKLTLSQKYLRELT